MKRTFVVVLIAVVDALSISRRHAIRDGISVAGFGAAIVVPSSEAQAAKGAAELDFEYYMRDLAGGNKKEGTIQQSEGPPVPPPRFVKDPLRQLLLNDSCSVDCLSTLALIEVVIQASPRGPAEDPRQLERDIQKKMMEYRERAKNSFYIKAPWKSTHVSDQYYFDLTAYAFWRAAADLLPNYKDRERFVRKLGKFLYKNLVRNELLKTKPLLKSRNVLVSTTDCMDELLTLFTDSGFCTGFSLGEKAKFVEDQQPVFDELDDDAIASGSSVDCIVSIFQPATLGSSLQITGEQSRFTPDFVGPTLAAMWESAGVDSTWETFFLDPEYRPNPKDYFPTEQLFQFTLATADSKNASTKKRNKVDADNLSDFW